MKSGLIILGLFSIFGFTDQIEISEKYDLIIFEGSDWCVNCIRLERNILSDTAFIKYLDHKKIRLLKIDFPQRKKLSREQKSYNEQIAGKYNFEGIFPTIIIARSDTLRFEKISYQNQSVQEIVAVISQKLEKIQ
jgi:thiamine biosynthesis lipoprotein